MKFILMLAVVLLSGCVGEPKQEVDNGNFTLHLLFEQDGCKVYRFRDGGRYIYWSNCKGSVQYDSGGKTSHHIQSITSSPNQ